MFWGCNLRKWSVFLEGGSALIGARRPDPSLACGISSEGSPGLWLVPVRIRCQRAPQSRIQINTGNWPSGKSLMVCGKSRGALMKSFTAVLGSRKRIARGQVLGPSSSFPSRGPFLLHGRRMGAVLALASAHLQARNEGCPGPAVPHFPQTPANLTANHS